MRMKEVRWQDFAKPLALLPFVFLGIYLFENGFDFIAGMLIFVLVCITIAAVVLVKE